MPSRIGPFLRGVAGALLAASAAGWAELEVLRLKDGHQVTGEVIDMACYLDHNATGAKHADCAKTCVTSGLPVGLKGEDGKTYLLIGEHKPANAMLAQYAAKTITVRGKAVSRDGINMIENVEVVK